MLAAVLKLVAAVDVQMMTGVGFPPPAAASLFQGILLGVARGFIRKVCRTADVA
jgi:hypothetical protein